MQDFRERGLRLIGHTFDGEPRMRKVALTVFGPPPDAAAESGLRLEHPLIQTAAIRVSAPGSTEGMGILAIGDWLHICWRLRNLGLDPKRRLDIGGALVELEGLDMFKAELNLSSDDLDPSNKQSYIGQSHRSTPFL